MDKKNCWMCDRKKYEALDEGVHVNRLVEETGKYYVIVPRDPHVWCHIMIVLKEHREGLVNAQKKDLRALIEPVHEWSRILSQGLRCDRVYLVCLCDSQPGERHLHHHLIPVRKDQKVYYGYGLQWLGHLEWESEIMPFKNCSKSEKEARGKYIKSMVSFLKRESAKKYHNKKA